MRLRVYMSVQAMYGAGPGNALYWNDSERQNSMHLTLLKRQNTKTFLYKLSKNHWVIALFEFFSEKNYNSQSLWITLYWCLLFCCLLPVLNGWSIDLTFDVSFSLCATCPGWLAIFRGITRWYSSMLTWITKAPIVITKTSYVIINSMLTWITPTTAAMSDCIPITVLRLLNVTTKTSYVIINPMLTWITQTTDAISECIPITVLWWYLSMLTWITKAPIVTSRALEMCPKLT